MVTIPTITAVIALVVMGLQLVAIAYSGFMFFSRQTGLSKDVAAMQKDIEELPTFSQNYKSTSVANTKAIADILQVVSVIPNLQQRMLTAEVYMRENGSLRSDINVISERTGNLVKLIEGLKDEVCTISKRQWNGLEREKVADRKIT